MSHKIQIDDEIRDATPEEVAAIEARQAAFAKMEQDAAATRSSARAKLKALGLTDDEIASLIP